MLVYYIMHLTLRLIIKAVSESLLHAEEMGTSHQKTVTKLELKLTEMSEELNAWATEYGQIREENAHLHSMLGVVVLFVGMIIALIMMC
jgi:cell shape-determining protein MreC